MISPGRSYLPTNEAPEPKLLYGIWRPTGRTANNTPQTTTCGDWSVTTGMTFVGVNDTSFYPEKLSKYSVRCDFVSNIICFVDP